MECDATEDEAMSLREEALMMPAHSTAVAGRWEGSCKVGRVVQGWKGRARLEGSCEGWKGRAKVGRVVQGWKGRARLEGSCEGWKGRADLPS